MQWRGTSDTLMAFFSLASAGVHWRLCPLDYPVNAEGVMEDRNRTLSESATKRFGPLLSAILQAPLADVQELALALGTSTDRIAALASSLERPSINLHRPLTGVDH